MFAVVAGLGGVGIWLLTARSPQAVQVEAPPVPAPPHASAAQLLTATAERLHREALAHFHADPKNGRARMPVVFEKVVKEWKAPWFSTGELDRQEPVPFAKDMARIHGASLHDFLSPPPPPNPDPANEPLAILWDAGKYDPSKKVWEPKSVDLIGLLKHDTPVVYISEKISPENDEPSTRPLDDFELVGLEALDGGEELFGRARDDVIRLLGAVRAEASCLSCHRRKSEGDLLGAFSYTLREGTYERVAWPGRGRSKTVHAIPADR
jgi:hypothetical protein